MDMDKVKRYRDLRVAAASAGAESKGLTAEADALERQLIEQYAEEGVQNIRVDGSTVYLERKVYAQKEKGPDGEVVETSAVTEALIAAGLGDFVTPTYNVNTLSAYLRELDEQGEPLPEALVGLVRPAEVFKLKHRKAGSSRH